MSDIEYNRYLNKFSDRYLIKTDECMMRCIEGKYGKIAPFYPEKQLLGCWCINLTSRRKKIILDALSDVFIEVHQDCDYEFGAYFNESNLDAVAKVIKARHRKNLSSDQRKILSERARKNFNTR